MELRSVIYWLAFVDMSASSMVVTVLASYLKETLHLSATSAGAVMSVYGIVQFFSSPVVGSVGDNHGFGRVLALCLFACGPAYLLLGSANIVVAVVVARFVCGLFKHTQNLLKTIIGVYLRGTAQLDAFGRVNAVGNAGFIVGPFVAGHIAELAGGYWAVFWISASVYVGNGLLAYACFPQDKPVTDVDENLFTPDTDDVSTESKSNDSISPVGILGTFAQELKRVDWSRHWDLFAVRFLLSASVLLFRSNTSWLLRAPPFSLSHRQLGYIVSYQGAVSLAVSSSTSSVARIFPSAQAFFVASSALLTASIGAAAFVRSMSHYVVAITLICAASSLLRALSYNLAAGRCRPSEMGLLTGVSASLFALARAVSPALGGVLHDISPLGPVVAALALATAALGIIIGVSAKSSKVDGKKED